ncbi:MAG: fibronectin type III domain-containing protein, partial [Mogibacterium sp.]|nr:fibronectin type III domain-containing protein [Mogibacterium sp.]
MKNRTLSESNSTIIRTAVRMMLTLMLTIAMVAPMASPADAFAKSSTATAAAAPKYTVAREQTVAGYNLYIDRRIIKEKRLSVAPTDFKAEGKRNGIELTWTAPSAYVRGYYILKKDLTGDTWRRIATVKADCPTKYTDTEASEKDTFYQYSIVAYKLLGN